MLIGIEDFIHQNSAVFAWLIFAATLFVAAIFSGKKGE